MTRLGNNHLINNPIIHRLLRRHEKVPIAIRLDLILRLIAILGNVRIQHLANEENLLRLNLNVGGLALRSSEGLVDHDSRVGQGASLARRSGSEEEGSHGCCHAKADCGDIAGNVLHGVVNGHAGRDAASGTVDVEGNVFGGVLLSEVE